VTGAAVLAHRGIQLALPAFARLFVMTMLAKIGEDARFLALLFEALESALEIFVVVNDDFRQNLLPPFVAIVAPECVETYKLSPI
jgi:hypothetical protein